MKPNRSLIAFTIFVVLFFVIPGHIWVMQALTPWALALPTFGVAGLPSLLIVHLHLSAVLALLAAYVGINLATALAFKLLRIYHYEPALARLAAYTDGRGVRGLARLTGLAALLGLVLSLALAPFGPTEGVAVLSLLMTIVSFSAKDRTEPSFASQS